MSGKIVFLLIMITFLNLSLAAKILMLHPSPSKSHLIVAHALTKRLAERGHEITVFSQFPLDKPIKNYRDIKIEVKDTFSEVMKNFIKNSGKVWAMLASIPKMINSCTEAGELTLEHPEFKRMMKEESFDLVIVGYFMTNFMLGVADHFKCPQIMISADGTFTSLNMVVGNLYGTSAVPHIATKYNGTMTFFQRVHNYFMYVVDVLLMIPYDYYQNSIYRKYFPEDQYISYDEAHRNVSLILVNQHFSQSHVRSFIPAMVEVGGLQIKSSPTQLPPNIQEWIDGAQHDVIFFSMGSNAKSTLLPKEKIDLFMNVFSKLKQRIIFKWETDELPGKPSNVLTGKWLPQDDILANPKVRLFISHCGLGSVAESKYHAVPIICMPLFADQMTNAAGVKSEGWGMSVPFETLTEEQLSNAINEIFTNPKYKEKVENLSLLFRDRPKTALETAVYWTEYVIRHRGAKHMQYPGVHLNFFQRNSLDVIGLLCLIFYVFIKFLMFIVFVCKKLIFRNKKQKSD